MLVVLPLVIGYVLDLLIGDPENWPHPVRVFGTLIANGERLLNQGTVRFLKGALLTVGLCIGIYLFFATLNRLILSIHPWLYIAMNGVWIWYGLANKGLITEGQKVFSVLQADGLDAGRAQLSRIVGRDTSRLSAQQIRIAVLETMSENLSDGVIAPLFFYALAGVPGMMAYKLINTMDSMVGYRSDRYEQFGKFAARLDDVVNFIPARLTALLMVLVTGSARGFQFILRYGSRHKSPNAGYPEAALAGILNCRFGGPNVYHGILVEKPFIGEWERRIEPQEINRASTINQLSCFCMVLGICGLYLLLRA
ncbi:adenosylcobinamide-phosphate synthase [Spirosoma endophyticum]|uniref:Cobalamin biosynthesis protein CobD n=2 Tax=Spirosoma endophyticum TaxID=662367 RepID=A0A1I1G6Z3_9BACT|nr:adenosylcobinamide-phosphate synthase [Spirosoma endophyticum]